MALLGRPGKWSVALVILVVLGGFTAIIALRTKGTTCSVALSDLGLIQEAIEQFAARTGSYPDELIELVNGGPDDTSYLPGIPADPWGRPYLYYPPTAPESTYTISSLGSDGSVGGVDDDADIVRSYVSHR